MSNPRLVQEFPHHPSPNAMYNQRIYKPHWQRYLLLVAGSLSLALAIGLIIGAGLPKRATYTGWSINGQSIAPEFDSMAPLFERHSIDGRVIDLGDLRGNPVIINFWATWCIPCALEMPILQEIYEQYDDGRLHILAVNMGESSREIISWLDGRGFTYDILLDPGLEVTTLYQVRVQPSTLVVAPDGMITEIYYGPVTARQLITSLERTVF